MGNGVRCFRIGLKPTAHCRVFALLGTRHSVSVLPRAMRRAFPTCVDVPARYTGRAAAPLSDSYGRSPTCSVEIDVAMPERFDITQTLMSAGRGDREAVDQLLPLVYDELRRLAQSYLQSERTDHTLQATALVHEAYIKMIDQSRVQWNDRSHFFALASQAIRRILVDHARGRGRKKRVGNRQRLSLDDGPVASNAPGQDALIDQSADLLDLDETLQRFAIEHPEKARLVEMRFFGGLTVEECAQVMGVTTRTVERHWQYARAWLFREMACE